MTLLIPGLDEDIAKAFTKRLHKSLKQREKTPSLTQLQMLVAQAVGHADWHAAQAYWAEGDSTKSVKVPDKKAPHEKAGELKDLLQSFAILLTKAKQEVPGSLADLIECVWALRELANQARLEVAKELLYQAYSSLRALEESTESVAPLDLEKLERLVQRATVGLLPFYMPDQPVPVLPPPPPGVVDEPVASEIEIPPLSEAEAEERERLYYETVREECDAIEEQTRVEWFPVFDSALPKAMAHLEDLKTGSDKALSLLLVELKRLKNMGIEMGYHWASHRLDAAIDLIELDRHDPMETQDRILRIENHVLRARSMLMEFFLPNHPRDTFPSGEDELVKGAMRRGDWNLLVKAMDQAKGFHHPFRRLDYEDAAAVTGLCTWWNSNVPEWAQGAGGFMVWVLSSETVQHIEHGAHGSYPYIFAEDFAQSSCYALFRSPLGCSYAVQFLKGKAHDQVTAHGRRSLQANGLPVPKEQDMGTNAAFHAIRGLKELARDVETRISY